MTAVGKADDGRLRVIGRDDGIPTAHLIIYIVAGRSGIRRLFQSPRKLNGGSPACHSLVEELGSALLCLFLVMGSASDGSARERKAAANKSVVTTCLVPCKIVFLII